MKGLPKRKDGSIAWRASPAELSEIRRALKTRGELGQDAWDQSQPFEVVKSVQGTVIFEFCKLFLDQPLLVLLGTAGIIVSIIF